MPLSLYVIKKRCKLRDPVSVAPSGPPINATAMQPQAVANKLDGMNIVIDFETYYSKDYSSRKMATFEYIRDTQFKVHGVGIQIDDNDPEWWTDNIEGKLKAIDWSQVTLIGHNLYFDASILFEHYSIVPARRLDTMSIAQALFESEQPVNLNSVAHLLGLGHKIAGSLDKTKGIRDLDADLLTELGTYCLQDVHLTREIFDKLISYMPNVELALIDLTLRMSTVPVLELDATECALAIAEADNAQQTAIAQSNVPRGVLSSNPKFAAYLKSIGLDVPVKKSKTTGKDSPALGQNDPEFIQLMVQHPELQNLWDGRAAAKSNIALTRARSWEFLRTHGSGKMPMPLKYYGAHTGRWSGTDKLNVQNLPRGSRLRRAITAPPGHVVLVGDSSQIELRMNAWFSGQTDVLEAQRNGDCVYRNTAAKHFKKDPVDITKDERQFGKIMVLGCIAENTLVLVKTNAAPFLTPIQLVTEDHLLWDGVEWVQHQGLIEKGVRKCVNVDNVWMTPDHKLLCGTNWTEAENVAHSPNTLYQILATGSKNLPSQDTNSVNEAASITSSLHAPAVLQNTKCIPTICTTGKVQGVTLAPNKKPDIGSSATGNTQIFSQATKLEFDYSTESPQSSKDAKTQNLAAIQITEQEASKCGLNGSVTEENFFATSLPLMVGNFRLLSSTESTIIAGTNPETLDSATEIPTCLTGEQSNNCRPESSNLSKKLPTYDIALAGPRNRFTLKTANGFVIAHNCGYGMGSKKFKHFCASGPLGMAPLHLTDDEAAKAITTYRSTNSNIAAMWRKLDDVIKLLPTKDLDQPFKCLRLFREQILLPNGMSLLYYALKPTEEGGWLFGNSGKRPLWGGTLLENIIQALARIVVAEQMLKVDALPGVRVVGCTHDEIIAVCPEHYAEIRFNQMIGIMSQPPEWAPDLPLAAEGGWAKNYSK